jgi:ATP-dependent DNA helicase DinG
MSEIAAVLGADGPLARHLPGFAPRAEQIAMAEAVERALATRSELLVEAGTGTGKTYAYLVPVLRSAAKVIVSTATRSLQDQLYHRDLPALAAALGRPLKVALLKGRANYLCRHRLGLARGSPALPGFAPPGERALRTIERWAATTKRGDIAELTSIPEADAVWAHVTSTRDNCLGQSCPSFRDCHVVLARREAQAAELVIVNHHLLLADLALKEEGFGELLPGADAVILDEAHQFPDVALQFFGLSIASRAVATVVRDAIAELTRAGLLDAALRAELGTLEAAAAAALAALSSLPARVPFAEVPDLFLDRLVELGTALATVAARLDDERLEVPGVRAVGRRAATLAARLEEFEALGAEDGLRVVETGTRGFTLEFTPFRVAERLTQQVRSRPWAWIHTSATLAVGSDFRHYAEKVGAEEAETLRIDSPFDYRRNARLYLPRGLPEPAAPGYTRAVVEAALPVVRAAGGGAFLLFTSHRALSEAAGYVRGVVEALGLPLLVQGESPRDALLRRFRELGNAVLLGTGSFWEGVDVPGRALSLVVIDKLPFASPDDPLLKARLEGLRREGRNGFTDCQLPQAVLALKQGVGRLIRATDDRGVIMLCDPRLTTKGYGRSFLASLPDIPVLRELGPVEDFLAEALAPVAAPAAAGEGG